MTQEAEPMRIRAPALARVAHDVRELERTGGITRQALLARLRPEDLPYLDGEIREDWCPVATHDRLLTVLRDVLGRGTEEFLVERGRRAGQDLRRLSLVKLAERVAAAGDTISAAWWGKAGHLLVTLPSALFSHSSWLLLPDQDPGRFTLEVSDAAQLPESSRLALQGALETLARDLVGRDVRVTSTRPARDRIVYSGRPIR